MGWGLWLLVVWAAGCGSEAAPNAKSHSPARERLSGADLQEAARHEALGAELEAQELGHCEQAFAGLRAAADLVRRHNPDEAPALPSREHFLTTCEALPEGARRCMRMSYALEHPAECADQQDSMLAQR